MITLESEDKTYRELQRYMETLEDRLRRIESVSNLRRYGVQNEQISVYLDPDKLAAYGLDTRMLMTTLFTQGFTTASGSLENGGLDIPHPPFRDLSLGAGGRRADPAGRCRRAYDPLERRGPYRTGISRAG